MDKYGDYLYSYALYRISDLSLAQELVQDTLTAAIEAKKNFKGKSSEKTWLTGILKYKIIDSIRKKYREPVFDSNFFESTTTADNFDKNGKWKTGPAKWASNPEHLLEQKSFLNIVKQCLKDLPKRPARALALREMEGESTRIICDILNVTRENCWVILHRARSLMRKCIEARWLEEK